MISLTFYPKFQYFDTDVTFCNSVRQGVELLVSIFCADQLYFPQIFDPFYQRWSRIQFVKMLTRIHSALIYWGEKISNIHTSFFCVFCAWYLCVCVWCVLFKPGFVLDICVCVEAKQTSLLWEGAAVSQLHNPRDDSSQQSHKTCRSGICTFFIRWTGSKKRFETLLFLSGFQKVFLRSSLVEWVVLATCQPIVCYCLWDIFGFQVNIADISISFFSDLPDFEKLDRSQQEAFETISTT